MASKGKWTVVFEDKMIIKNYAEGASEGIGASFSDVSFDSFWNQPKFSNIWAIQYGNTPTSDEVEYRDDTPHSAYDSSVLGDISQFIDKWDDYYLNYLQSQWDHSHIADDEGNSIDETEAEKIARLGPRPTSYSSE